MTRWMAVLCGGFVVAALATGCVSKQAYEGLKSRNQALQICVEKAMDAKQGTAEEVAAAKAQADGRVAAAEKRLSDLEQKLAAAEAAGSEAAAKLKEADARATKTEQEKQQLVEAMEAMQKTQETRATELEHLKAQLQESVEMQLKQEDKLRQLSQRLAEVMPGPPLAAEPDPEPETEPLIEPPADEQ